ncbi:MAG: cytochrome-c peroxidase [Rhodoferax sp.]|nr:cytochrome-c peroxidase [Rhodoferax sp.]
MKLWGATVSLALWALIAVGLWQAKVGEPGPASFPQNRAYATSPGAGEALLPLPPAPPLPADKVALGKRLFFEPRLSHDDSLACAGCHDFARGGADRLPAAVGVGGKQGNVNTPTVFNAGLGFVQFWDGRAASLEEQAAGPVHNPLEMASNWPEVIAKLSRDADYQRAFQQLYQGISGEAIVDAIATYERTLLTPNSRFDRFLRGDKAALDALEQDGYRRFLDYGCASCHQGALLGGNMYQRFGVMGDYFSQLPANRAIAADQGRFNVTGREEDRHVFKVPGLRNVAVTAPYFHNGSAATLEEAVVTMGRYQLGRDLSGADILAICAFLRTLTGEWEGKPLQ